MLVKKPMKDGTGKDIGTLIGILFLSREVAHREHLSTKSFSAHMALGTFYDNIVERADAITEAYQGRNQVLINIPFVPYTHGDVDIISCLKEFLAEIEDIRYTAVSKDDTPIQNLIDEAVAIFLSTIYKLTFLK